MNPHWEKLDSPVDLKSKSSKTSETLRKGDDDILFVSKLSHILNFGEEVPHMVMCPPAPPDMSRGGVILGKGLVSYICRIREC